MGDNDDRSVVDFDFSSALEPLQTALAKVDRPGSFCGEGKLEAPLFNLSVRGFGRVALPVSAEQGKALAAVGEQAPYGRGADTIIDTSVRRARQIEPSEVTLSGKAWTAVLERIVASVCLDLGVDLAEVEARFYKLLVYEKGSFFAAHRDTEKADGMFGTLCVALPSEYSGGELVARHQGAERRFDLRSADLTELSYAAFYADCEHEVEPLVSGVRVMLIYTLAFKAGGKVGRRAQSAPNRESEVRVAAAFLEKWRGGHSRCAKIVYLLEHYYTEAELDFRRLKGADDAVARTLLQAADLSSCVARLALVRMEESGAAEYDGGWGYGNSRGRRRYWDDDESIDEGEDCEDFEVVTIDEWTREAVCWLDEEGRSLDLGAIPVEDDEMLPADALRGVKPDSQRIHEASGNEGASYERAYRKAAIELWPKGEEHRLLAQGKIEGAVGLIAQLAGSGDESQRRQGVLLASAIIDRWAQVVGGGEYLAYAEKPSAKCMLEALSSLGSADLVDRFVAEVLATAFEGPEAEALAEALALLAPKRIEALVSALFSERGAAATGPCARLLAELESRLKGKAPRAALGAAAATLIAELPETSPDGPRGKVASRIARFDVLKRGDRGTDVSSELPRDLLQALWRLGALGLMARAIDRFLSEPSLYAPDIDLLPACVELDEELSANVDFRRLFVCSMEAVLMRSSAPPPDPKDWALPGSIRCECEDCRDLRQFVKNPLQREHRFRVATERRKHLHMQVEMNDLALVHETERKGRPYTLVCSKTRRDFQRVCARYRKDQVLIGAFLNSAAGKAAELGAVRARAAAAVEASRDWVPAGE